MSRVTRSQHTCNLKSDGYISIPGMLLTNRGINSFCMLAIILQMCKSCGDPLLPGINPRWFSQGINSKVMEIMVSGLMSSGVLLYSEPA
jgi:hypothetical protein